MTNATDIRPTILLTGFGPFPGIPQNVSGDLVDALARETQRALPAFHVASAILPTEWERAPQLIASLHAHHAPVLALHFGVANGTRGLRLETTARNICRVARDAAGALPASIILERDGADIRPSTIETRAVAAVLEAQGYTVALSDDAGGYLCNAVLYHSLAAAEASGGKCKVGFVHIPADLPKADFTMAEAVGGALEIVKMVLAIQTPPRC